MTTEEDLNTFAGRLATFERPHHFAKRRASSSKKKAQSAVTWPHGTPTPDELARAGFYYKPSPTSQDSVTCFLCDKALDGWESGDNPATEHLAHVPQCGWAINVCIEQRSQDMDRAEEDPSEEQMVESRRATFRDAWPHESRKGWKCKVQKMVEAGWCYTPLPEADDCVHCFYCGVSLDGWEPKDDPWDEHRKRAPDCHFFTLIEESTKLKRRTKNGKGRVSSKVSKASRTSTQSNSTTNLEVESMLSGTDDEPAEEDDTILTTATVASKGARGGKKGGRKAAPKRTKSAKGKEDTVIQDLVDDAPVEASLDAHIDTVMSPKHEESMSQPTKTRGKRPTKIASNHADNADKSVVDSALPTRKVSRVKKPRKQQKTSEEVTQLQPEMKAEVSASPKNQARSTRGKKRSSDGTEKIDSSMLDSMPVPSRGRAPSSKEFDQIDAEMQENPDTELQQPYEGQVDVVEEPSVIMIQQADEPAAELTPANAVHKGKKARAVSKQAQNNVTPVSSSVVVVIEKSARNDSPSMISLVEEELEQPPTPQGQTRLAQTASPQSSDAENVPPSSRPSLVAATGGTTTRVPLATTPPQTSPSKRNIIAGGLSTTQAWSAVDLETIFLPSPSSKAARADQENLTLESVLRKLTSPEKQMSVEEWILWNAHGAEQKLRGECERLIGIFEGEGNRALRCLEGIEAS